MCMQIAFHHERPIPAASILSLYKQKPHLLHRSMEDVETMLQNGGTAVGVWLDQQLIGFARAVTDGHFGAYIEEVWVDQRYPQARIKQKLIVHLLKALQQVEAIHLLCALEMPFGQPFALHKAGIWFQQYKKAGDLLSPA